MLTSELCFFSAVDAKTSTSKAYGILARIPIPFPLPDKIKNGCNGMSPHCPIKKGTQYKYTTALPVSSSYPSVSTTIFSDTQFLGQLSSRRSRQGVCHLSCINFLAPWAKGSWSGFSLTHKILHFGTFLSKWLKKIHQCILHNAVKKKKISHKFPQQWRCTFKIYHRFFWIYFNIVDLCGILPYKRMYPYKCGIKINFDISTKQRDQ